MLTARMWRTGAIVVLLAAVLGRPSSPSRTAAAAFDNPPAGVALYAETGRGEGAITRIDPLTLADIPGADAAPSLLALVSADQTTSVEIVEEVSGADVKRAIVVREAGTGIERSRVPFIGDGYPIAVSRDGARMLTMTGQSGGEGGVTIPTWAAYDTRSGQRLATVPREGQGFGPYGWHTALADPDLTRLYRPFVPGDRAGDGPLALTIAINDLGTGAELARAAFPEIPAGSWWGPRVDQIPVNQVVAPAVALSPDGARLVVAHADRDRVTILDAATLAPVRTLDIAERRSAAGRIGDWLAWLAFAPQPAAAKILDGRVLQAAISSDGRTLSLWGRQGAVADTPASASETGLGLRRIDLETGEVIAEGLPGAQFDQIIALPDGPALYALGPDVPWTVTTGESSYTLRRLDPDTLDPLAERAFPARLRLIARPSATTAG